MKKTIVVLTIAIATLTLHPAAYAGPSAYPLKTCIVTDDDLGDTPIDITYKGRLVRLCCKSCVRKFNANPDKYMAVLDKALAKKKA